MKWQAGGAEASIHSARMKTPPLPARTPGCEEGGGGIQQFQIPRVSDDSADYHPAFKGPKVLVFSHFNGCDALNTSHLNTLSR